MPSAWDCIFWGSWVVLAVCVVIRVMADCPELAPQPKPKRPKRAPLPERIRGELVAHA